MSQQTSMLSTAYNQTQFNQNQSNPTPSTYTPAQAPQFLQYQESVPDVFNSSPHQSFYSQNDIGQRQPQPQPLGFHPIVNMPFNLLASPPNAQEISKTSVEGLIPFHVSVSKHPSASCDSRYKRCTLQQVPATQALLSKSKLPFGLIVSPYKQADGNCEIPIINPETIVRCRRCRL